MTDEQPAPPPRVSWVHSLFNHERKVARPTLSALNALLGGGSTDPAIGVHAAPDVDDPSAVELAALPGLSEIGGVARIEAPGEAPLAVARVGRRSFVGYRMDESGLAEVHIEMDETAAKLVIGNDRGASGHLE
ncbi:MAG: hypothetical protein ABI587_13115 [Gemmatimonadales bacterium]